MQTLQKYLLKKNNSLNQNNIFDSQSISVTKNSIMNSSTSFDTQYNNIQEGGNQTDLKKRTHYEVSNFINNDISRFENTEVSVSDSDTSVFLNNTAKHLNQLTGGNVELNTNASTEEFLDYVENKLNNNLTGGDINNILQDSFMKGINNGGYIDNDTITQQDILNRLRLYVNGNQQGGESNEDEYDVTDDDDVTDPKKEEGKGEGEGEGEDEGVTNTDSEEEEKEQNGGRRKNNSSDSSSSSDEDDSSSDSSSSIEENSSSIKLKIKSKRLNGNSKINDDNLTDEEDDDSSSSDEEDESDKLFETKEKTKRSVNKIDNINVLGSEDDEDDEDDDVDDDDDEDDDDDDDDDDDSSDSEDKSSDDKKTKDNKKKSDYNADSLSSIIISSSKASITPYMMSSDYSLHTDDINLISFSPKNMKKNKKK